MVGLKLQVNQAGQQNEIRFNSDSDLSAAKFPEVSISGIFGGSTEDSLETGLEEVAMWLHQGLESSQRRGFGSKSQFHTTLRCRSDSPMKL